LQKKARKNAPLSNTCKNFAAETFCAKKSKKICMQERSEQVFGKAKVFAHMQPKNVHKIRKLANKLI
jgi:hypothetical protein